MELDWTLASLHHLAVFTLVALLASEIALTSGAIEGTAVARLARVDAAFGIAAAAVVVFGVARVFLGDKGAAYYGANSLFQAKMTIFVVVGGLSVLPTLRILRWRREARGHPQFRVEANAVAKIRRILWLEAGLVALLPILAAGMARGFGS